MNKQFKRNSQIKIIIIIIEHDNEHNSREILNGRLIHSYKVPKRFTSFQNTFRYGTH